MVGRAVFGKRISCRAATLLFRSNAAAAAAVLPFHPVVSARNHQKEKYSPLRSTVIWHESHRRGFSTLNEPAPVEQNDETELHKIAAVLDACPGCGAVAQAVEPGEAGFYSTKRRVVQSYIQSFPPLESNDSGVPESDIEPPLCDRCHHLVHHHTGSPIAHPSVDSIRATIEESPYKHNHIYYVIDAADFPMSLIPHVHSALGADFQGSTNRRSKSPGFRHGRKTELTFVITRADLLAPKKEQIDRLMQYFISVLRDTIAPSYSNSFRLGNVRCVSSKRGWWTKTLKDSIWERGGATWMVGKVNVGKSNLFEVVFPKGSSKEEKEREKDPFDTEHLLRTARPTKLTLLPPARQESAYPVMPTISSLPGTTASPIRVSFDKSRGEVIDLPGLARSDLDTYVAANFKEDLVMKSRITPKQQTIKPGQSLLLGGLIRITPLDPELIVLAYPFVNIKPHLTSTDKAIVLETEGKVENSGIPIIVEDGVGKIMASAGRFQLKWDVTRQRTGPLTTRSGVGLKPDRLPFQVLGADILIEGVGWVEIVAQVRKTRGGNEPKIIPEVEVFSPHGQHVGVRPPMNAWAMGGLATRPSVKHRKERPRRSMAATQRKPSSD